MTGNDQREEPADAAPAARAMACGVDGVVFLMPVDAGETVDGLCERQLDRVLAALGGCVPTIRLSGRLHGDAAAAGEARAHGDAGEARARGDAGGRDAAAGAGPRTVAQARVALSDLRGALAQYAAMAREAAILRPALWVLDPLWLPFVERAYARLVIYHDLRTEPAPEDAPAPAGPGAGDAAAPPPSDAAVEAALAAEEAPPPAFDPGSAGAGATAGVDAPAREEWLGALLERHVHGTVLALPERARDLARIWPFVPGPRALDALVAHGRAGVDAWFSELAARPMRESGKLDILMLCAPVALKINTVREYVESFATYSRHSIKYAAAVHKAAPHRVALPAPVSDYNNFDVVMIHYSARICVEGYIDSDVEKALINFAGFKILFIQDEYNNTEAARRWIERIGIHLVYTVVPEPHVDKVYPRGRFAGTEFVSILTGYAPIALENAIDAPPLRDRPNHIVYRGNALPFYYGELGREKLEIGERMRAIAEERGIPVDIEWLPERKIHGRDWYRFLQSGRATLATESGTNIFDIDGELKRRVDAHVKENPDATFEEVHAAFLAQHEAALGFRMNQISPKLFEFAAARTALILYRGEYSGVIQPDVHYIPLEKDFSNIDDVLAKLEDLDGLEAMVERAFQHMIASGRYRYGAFVKAVDDKLARHVRGGAMLRASSPDFGMLEQAVSLRQQLALLGPSESIGSDNAAMDNLIARANFKKIHDDLSQRLGRVIETNRTLRAGYARIQDAHRKRGEQLAELRGKGSSDRERALRERIERLNGAVADLKERRAAERSAFAERLEAERTRRKALEKCVARQEQALAELTGRAAEPRQPADAAGQAQREAGREAGRDAGARRSLLGRVKGRWWGGRV